MHTKIWLIISIIVFIFVNSALQASTTANPYDKDDLKLYDVKKLYHSKINDTFNTSLQLLEKGEKGTGTDKIPQGDNCEEKNYSTFCVAMRVANEYELYETALKKRQKSLISDGSITTIDEVAARLATQSNAIETEIISAQQALDTSLATYNDIALYYAMHLEYEKIIKSLTKYNVKLEEFRKEVEKYPSKFIDPTTPKCT